MNDPINMSPAETARAVYVAIAVGSDDPVLDISAGITAEMVQAHPGMPEAAITAAIDELDGAIATHRPDPELDLSPNAVILMTRILGRVVPALTGAELREGATRYTRAFLRSARRDTDQLRQVAPLELQFDRLAAVDRFRRDRWQQLYDTATNDAAVGRAIDQSSIAEVLGVRTTDDVPAMLSQVPIQPLATFVLGSLQSDGSLATTSDAVEAVLTTVSGELETLRTAYVDNLIEIDAAEQEARDEQGVGQASFRFRARRSATLRGLGFDTQTGRTLNGTRETQTTKSRLAQAIEKAEAKQKELDETLKSVRTGAKGTLEALSALAGVFDSELAADLKEFAGVNVTLLNGISTLANAAVGTARFVEKLSSAGLNKLLLGGTVAFHFVAIAAAIQIFGILGKPRTKSPNQIILEQLQKISKQITDLRDELRVRFDRIDKRLDTIYAGILNRFAEIDFELGQIEGNVDEVQFSLYVMHAELLRLHRDIHTLLEAAHRRDLVEGLNGFLAFRERTGQDLSFEQYVAAENLFFSWGFNHAKDPLQAGPPDRAFEDDALVGELTAFPLATNVNYLSRLPTERLNLPGLAQNRLANPFDWIVAGEAYAQLAEESPAHAARISPNRSANLASVGTALGNGLDRIADFRLFDGLAGLYRSRFAELKTAINAVESEFRNDPAIKLEGIDMFGDAEQTPNRHFFRDGFDDLRRCDGRSFDASNPTVPTNVFAWDHSALEPYMIAHNLRTSRIPGVGQGLQSLSACVKASWRTIRVEDTGLGGRVRVDYRLTITVEVRYGTSVIFVHTFNTPEPHAAFIRRDQLGTFDPATDRTQGKDPYPLLVRTSNGLWRNLSSFPATHTLVNPSLRASIAATVEQRLKLLQRAFYGDVAQAFERAGDPVQQIGRRLTGAKLLLQSYAIAGLPLSVEANEILRSFLFGSDAILAGSDIDKQDGLLDDVQDIYAFFSARSEDPLDVNILGEIEALADERLDAFAELVDEIIEGIETSGQPEASELFAPTLLRLSLVPSASPGDCGQNVVVVGQPAAEETELTPA